MSISVRLRRPLALSCLTARSLTPSIYTLLSRSFNTTSPVSANYWDKDFKPGPYPKTEEERRKAAEKYNLPLGAYEPYPDDGTGKGDYPKLPNLSEDARDPFYPWDNPETRRNFNEPIAAEFLINNRNRYDTNYVPRYTRGQMLAGFFGTIGIIVGLFIFFEDYKMFQPVALKQYPHEGPHYLFPGDKQPGSGSHHH